MKAEVQAYCPYCGVQMFVEADADAGGEELKRLAIEKCSCTQAVTHKKMERTEETMKMIVGEECVINGFKHPVSPETYDAIRTIARMVADGIIDNVTLKEPGGNGIGLRDSNTRVKIRRTAKTSMEL